jgi:hypothetical protein
VDIRDWKVRKEILPVFRRSNEGYPSGLRDALGRLAGIQEYVGVCGGGDQNIFLLGLLQRNNNLRGVTLVDYDVGQLLNFREVVDDFNAPADADYASAPEAVDISAWVDKNDSRHDWRDRRPELARDLEIRGVLRDIVDYVSGIGERRTYFLYFSNALFSHVLPERSRDALAGVLGNDAVARGSAVLLVQMLPEPACVLLRKESEVAFNAVFSENEGIAPGKDVDAQGICRALRRR